MTKVTHLVIQPQPTGLRKDTHEKTAVPSSRLWPPKRIKWPWVGIYLARYYAKSGGPRRAKEIVLRINPPQVN